MFSTPTTADGNSASGFFLLTGHNQTRCYFNVALHQLWLESEGQPAQKIDLGFSGTRLLERLLRNPGEVVSRDELIAAAWPERVVGQGSLNQQIYTLRQLLGDEKNRAIIQTLSRRGYLFNPSHILCEQTAPAPASPTTQPGTETPAQAPTHTHKRSRWPRLFLIPLALVSVMAAGTLQLFNSPQSPRLELGTLEIWVLADQRHSQQQVLAQTESLLQRLATLSTEPQQVVLSQYAGYYHLHCSRAANSHSLSIHQADMDQISDQQLRDCLAL